MKILSVKTEKKAEGTRRSGSQRLRRLLIRNRDFLLPGITLLILILVAFLAPLLTPYDPTKQVYGDELLGPSFQHWLGTDALGRDLLSRTLFGMRLSLTIGLVAATIGGILGLSIGLAAGYYEGWLDDILGRLLDTLLAFPALIVGLTVAVILGPSALNAAIAAAIINIPIIARITRAGIIGEKDREYSQAAVALGAGDGRVLLKHLLPNITPAILVQLTLTIAHSMILEAGLSFLGLGAQPPEPSLGVMLQNARSYMRDAPWLAVVPGASLSLLLLAISFFADALRDATDPRKRG
ncbi:MAG: ABC transporter permease [Trueperaceae bacterium]